MNLYDRDYFKLNDDEKSEWDKVKKDEIVGDYGGKYPIRKNLFHLYPKAARHHMSLFPNNYLDIVDLKDESKLNLQSEELHSLLDKDPSEREILNFIRDRKAFFIIGSILKFEYNFGHHAAYLFREFPLGSHYQADYLLIGDSSDGHQFVFVELESPKGSIALKDGSEGDVIRKGIRQVKDWNRWLEKNFNSLRETLIKYKNPHQPFPEEFNGLDKTRIHYVVVAGRREHFKDKTYTIKREYSDDRITLLHYDKLYDYSISVIGQPSY